MFKRNKRLIGILLTVGVLLLIPLIAMQIFDDEVKWTPIDFVVAGVLLLGTGLMCEMVLRKIHTLKYRLAVVGAILTVFALIWIELAVGLFGTPFAGS